MDWQRGAVLPRSQRQLEVAWFVVPTRSAPSNRADKDPPRHEIHISCRGCTPPHPVNITKTHLNTHTHSNLAVHERGWLMKQRRPWVLNLFVWVCVCLCVCVWVCVCVGVCVCVCDVDETAVLQVHWYGANLGPWWPHSTLQPYSHFHNSGKYLSQ